MSTHVGENNFSIGDRLKEEREKKGFSQDALGKKLLTSRKTVVNWEADSSAPDAKQLAEMYAMGMDVHYVVTGDRMPLSARQDVAGYKSEETQAILEAFSIAGDEGRAALLAVAALVKKKSELIGK